MSRMLLAAAVVGSALIAATTEASVVLPDGVPTIFLERGPGTGSTPMSVAYHPLFNYYYASNGGNPNFAAWVYDAAGNRIQDLGALGIDARGWNYNPNTGLLEVVAYGTLGLWEAQVDVTVIAESTRGVTLPTILDAVLAQLTTRGRTVTATTTDPYQPPDYPAGLPAVTLTVE